MSQAVTLIPGDGIGPEVADAARKVIDATGVKIDWRIHHAGFETQAQLGNPLPDATVASVLETKVALKGPTATPIGKGFRSVNVALRKRLDLYANYRPAKTFPGIESRYEAVDVIVIRENTEGLYSGLEHMVIPGVVESLRVVTEKGSERILRYAFNVAKNQERKKVTVVHKANILKMSDGLFLDVARKVASDFPDIEYEEAIVDATAMKLVLDPKNFDVLVMENLFGDILSDLASGLIGGLGVAPSANIGKDMAIFEAVHGSAPDIAGKGVANPTALVLSGALLLRHLGHTEQANKIESAVYGVLSEGKHLTSDIGGKAGTNEYTEALISKL